jgi:uncharacterized protein YjaG (DUF416 family)
MVLEIEKLKDLTFAKQAAFLYLTCERLYPNYLYFSNNYSFGDPLVLRNAIDYLYRIVVNEDLNKAQINSFVIAIEKNTPDTEDFDSPFVSSALDACTAILDSLHFLVDKNFARIENVSNYATDTVSMHVQDIEGLDYNSDKDFQKKIASHPLMKREVDIQTGIIAFLNKAKKIDFEDIKTLLLLQENDKKGSLNL